jgi:hypothetical protein
VRHCLSSKNTARPPQPLQSRTKDVVEASYRFASIKRWTGMEDAYRHYVRLKAPA